LGRAVTRGGADADAERDFRDELGDARLGERRARVVRERPAVVELANEHTEQRHRGLHPAQALVDAARPA